MISRNQQPVLKKYAGQYEFPAEASEITILDRLGHIIWRQRRSEEGAPIRWRGIDLYGTGVDVGSYIAKIIYENNASAVYLPFILMHD